MASIWELDEVERADPDRAACLRRSPPWLELIRQVREELRVTLGAGNVRFGFDESSRDAQDLRAIVQFPVGRQLFDWFFNGQAGYRAQFRIGRENGRRQNALLISELGAELGLSAPRQISARRLSYDFKVKESIVCAIDQLIASLDPKLSKVWICEQLIGEAGEIRELFVSRTGPRLTFSDSEPWSSLYPEDAAGWLDVKGAFIGRSGPYQLKTPEQRAANLEARGSA
jgi:hypothetical protein